MAQIVIVGAGVAGLSTAYYLRKMLGSDVSIIVLDKNTRVGGNANSLNVMLNNGDNRFVDMGVNDFNDATYVNLLALWKEIGINFSDYASPLINSEMYTSQNGSDAYFEDIYGGFHAVGKVNLQDIATGNANFQAALWKWYQPYQDDEAAAPDISVGEFLALPQYAGQFPPDFINKNLYPRINGMYFTTENAPLGTPIPSQMPLWMVAHYYVLQEGWGQSAPKGSDTWSRQYFIGGATRWLEYLAQVIQRMGVKLMMDMDDINVTHNSSGQGWQVNAGGYPLINCDILISGLHADDTYSMINGAAQSQDPMIQALTNFTSAQCEVVAHQDWSQFPPQPKPPYFMTYNIHVYDYDTLAPGDTTASIYRPYTITYVCNFHQNDQPLNKDPYFFVTVNPRQPIAYNLILAQQGTGYKASATFRHAKLDYSCMQGQVIIQKEQMESMVQGRDLYFCGSFTIGAGLHEECIIQAQDIANKIANPQYVSPNTYDFKKEKNRHFAPAYMVTALNNLKNAEKKS